MEFSPTNDGDGKNILLVYPRIPQDTYWSFNRILKYIGKKTSMPPLGLITVASMIPDNYNLRLVDMNFMPLKDEDIDWSDLVFTSSMVVQKDSLADVIKRVKSHRKPVVAGGPYPTQFFHEMESVDHFVLGEAESGVLEEFFADYENGGAGKVYARHIIRKSKGEKEIDQQAFDELTSFFGDDGHIRLDEKRPEMRASPVPRFNILDMHAYASMAVQLSRGCPHHCEFCNEPTLFGHVPRLKTGKQIVAELEEIVSSGYEGAVFVVDDNLVGNKRKVKEALGPMIEFQQKNDYPLDLFTEADITLSLDDELMRMMNEAGFDMVFMGLESTDKEVLRSMGKKQNVKIDLLEAVRKIQGHGIEVSSGLIVGTDDDPPDIHGKIFEFCQEAGIPFAMVSPLNAMKGSVLYQKLKKAGRLRGDFTGNNTHEARINFLPKQKDPGQIIREYRGLLDRLYDKTGENYFQRCQVLMENLGPRPKPSRDVRAKELRALALSLLNQSFLKPYSKAYRRFLGNTLRHHIRKFPEAVTQAIKYLHFRSITEEAMVADQG